MAVPALQARISIRRTDEASLICQSNKSMKPLQGQSTTLEEAIEHAVSARDRSILCMDVQVLDGNLLEVASPFVLLAESIHVRPG
jgi:hypothetical protein